MPASWSAWSCSPSAGHRAAPTSSCRSPPALGEGRQLPRLGGPRRAPSTRRCTAPARCPTAGCCRRARRRDGRRPAAAHRPRRPAPSSPRWARPAGPARASRLDVRPPAAPVAGAGEGGAGHLAAADRRRHACSATSRSWPAPPGRRGPDRRRRPPAGSAWPTATGSRSAARTGSITLPVADHRDARRRRLAAERLTGQRGAGRRSAPAPGGVVS